jgi:hypothetical protein
MQWFYMRLDGQMGRTIMVVMLKVLKRICKTSVTLAARHSIPRYQIGEQIDEP